VPTAINQSWSMDFMHDQLADGRSIRLFNVIDDFNREGLGHRGRFLAAIRAGHPIARPDHRMAWQAERDPLRQRPGIRQRRHLSMGRQKRGIRIDFIQPGQPQQNAYVERYNRTVRYDWLAHHLFETLDEIQEFATRWLWTYNHDRPNMALGGITPKQETCLAA
jgi:putative transposase